jgi:hypothetical protein
MRQKKEERDEKEIRERERERERERGGHLHQTAFWQRAEGYAPSIRPGRQHVRKAV